MKTIIVGSDFPDDLKKELLLRAKEVANRLPEEERKDVNIVELVDLECVKILQLRNQLASQENITDQIEVLESKERYKKDAITFINKFKTNTVDVKFLKSQTSSSWKQFNVILENWLMFGFITFLDERKTVVEFTIDEAEIRENILKTIYEDADNLIQKIRLTKSQFSPKEVRQMTAFENKLKFKMDVNR